MNVVTHTQLSHAELFQSGLHDGIFDGAEYHLDILGI